MDKCSRCGREYSKYVLGLTTVSWRDDYDPYLVTSRKLCEDCMKEFLEFVDKGRTLTVDLDASK